MIRLRALIYAAAFMSVAPHVARAQVAQAASAPAASGPRVNLTATAARNAVAPSPTPMLARSQNLGQPVALMIVGGAAILVGALVGGSAGNVIMVGGAVALIIGLYQYLE